MYDEIEMIEEAFDEGFQDIETIERLLLAA